jgi:hypothetical protein
MQGQASNGAMKAVLVYNDSSYAMMCVQRQPSAGGSELAIVRYDKNTPAIAISNWVKLDHQTSFAREVGFCAIGGVQNDVATFKIITVQSSFSVGFFTETLTYTVATNGFVSDGSATQVTTHSAPARHWGSLRYNEPAGHYMYNFEFDDNTDEFVTASSYGGSKASGILKFSVNSIGGAFSELGTE